MRYAGILVLTLAASCVAVDATEDAETSETEQAVWDGSEEAEGETILVQGGLDPCWAGLCWPSSWPADPGPGHTDDGPGAGGAVGHGGAGPRWDKNSSGEPEPIPPRKDCRKEMGEEACLDRCMWNHLHVDTPECAKLPRRKRRQCREEATEKLAICQVHDCDRHGIITALVPQ